MIKFYNNNGYFMFTISQILVIFSFSHRGFKAVQEMVSSSLQSNFTSQVMRNQDLHQYLSSQELKLEKPDFVNQDFLQPDHTAKIQEFKDFESGDHIDEPQFQVRQNKTTTQKAHRCHRRSTEQSKNMNRGHWSTDQNKKYHWFLQIHYRHFVNRHMRRMDKIFKTMELFIGTRQAEQCRSHHQKMEKKYFNFVTIMHNLRCQHYNGDEVQPIMEDMEANGITYAEKLATIEEMIQQQTTVLPVLEIKERKKSHCQKTESKLLIKNEKIITQPIEEEKQGQINFNTTNMLQDSHMNIGQISLYHEKESHLFNNMFDLQ